MGGLVSSQMSKDWNDYWNNSKAGDSIAWGNGTVTRNTDGSATYKSNGGQTTNFNAGMSIDDVAKSSSEIANNWANVYGYKAPTETQIPEFKAPTFSGGGGPGAVTRDVTGDELVSTQLQKLLSNGSPYLTQASNKAMQTAGERGLVNSSLAAGAGVGAAIDAAVPIASADANAYGTAARDNQSAKNSFNLADKQAANNAALTNLQMAGQAQLAGINAAYQQQAADKQFANNFQLQQSQNDFTAKQQKDSQDFQLKQLNANMDLAYAKLTTDQINTYAAGYLNIVNSNMPQADKEIALSGYSAIYGFHDNLSADTSIDLSGLPAVSGG